MLLITLILVAVSFKSLEAIIVDSYYMPSAPKQQVDTFPLRKMPRQPVARERQNEVDYVQEYPTVKPLYKYGYSVFDPYTLDVKSQWEHRDGDFVRGAYNMLEADGSLRIVEYTSDKDTGFRAIVKKIPFFLEQSRRQVENVPKYTSPNNAARTSAYQEGPATPVHDDSPINYQQNSPINYQQNEVNNHYNRQSENYIQHGNYFKQHYHNKQQQKKSTAAPIEVYKRLLPGL